MVKSTPILFLFFNIGLSSDACKILIGEYVGGGENDYDDTISVSSHTFYFKFINIGFKPKAVCISTSKPSNELQSNSSYHDAYTLLITDYTIPNDYYNIHTNYLTDNGFAVSYRGNSSNYTSYFNVYNKNYQYICFY